VWRRKLTDDEEVWRKISNADAGHLTHSTGRVHRGIGRFCAASSEIRRRPRMLRKTRLPRYGFAPTAFSPSGGSLRGYLYGIARKRAAEWWRNQTPSDGAAGPEPSDCKTEAAPLPLQQQMFARTASCLLGLTRNDSPALSGRGIVEF
jgi:hypothetical protein